MYAGIVGSQIRRGYTVISDEVNASARLMQACQPWQILVSSHVMQAAQKRYAFHQFPSFQVKGKSGPIPVAMPVAALPPSPAQWFTSHLVGRPVEIDCLEAALQGIINGRSKIVRIEGVEGIGKSRLAGEMSQKAMKLGIRILVGYAQSTGLYTPYSAWREIVHGLFGLQPAWPAQQQAIQMQTMLQWIAPEHLSLVPLLGDLLGITIPESPITSGLNSQERRQRLFSLLGDLLANFAAQQPLLVLLEDCQWLDQASAALLESISKRLAKERFLLLLTHRSDEENTASALIPRLRTLPNSLSLILDELSSQDVQNMLSQQLGGEISPELQALIQDRTQGNPLFIEEIAQAIRKTNWLQQKHGRWVLIGETFPVLQLPDTIRGVVLARLDLLDEQLRLTLKVASVVGRHFEISQLNQIHPEKLTPAQLEEQLTTLEKQNLLVSEISENQRRYRFHHTVIHEIAYETLLFSQRQELHRALAEWIERTYAADLTAYYPLLAHHYDQAGIENLALEYYLLGGDSARWLYAFQ